MADPKKKRSAAEQAYEAGQGARGRALDYGAAQRNVVAGAGRTFARPLVAATAAAEPYARGFLGAGRPTDPGESRADRNPFSATGPAPAPATPSAPSPQAPPAPTTSFAGTVGGSSTAPKDNLPGGVTRTLDAKGNAVYANTPGVDGSAPIVRRPTAPSPIATEYSFAPQVQATTERTLQGQRGVTLDTRADAASVLNPMSADAELMRRFEISQGYGSNKGSPQARRLAGEAILGQLGARNQASAAGQQAANATLGQGAVLEAGANQSYADRRLDADKANVASQQVDNALIVDQARPNQLVRALDGTTSVVRNDGTASTLRGEDGKAIQEAPTQVPGEVTSKDRFDARAGEIAAIQKNETMTPEERVAAIAEVDARYAVGGGEQEKPPAAYPNARKAPDGKWYIQNDDGSYSLVNQ